MSKRPATGTKELQRCMAKLGERREDALAAPKAADRKVAIAARLKNKHLCNNPSVGERLNMGAPTTVSRYSSELAAGQRRDAGKQVKRLS